MIFYRADGDDIFTSLTSKGKKHLINMLMNLFYAGMYQRTWQIRTKPESRTRQTKRPSIQTTNFPMRTVETRGSNLPEIERKMTPTLNNILNEFELLLPEEKNVVEELPIYGFPERLIEFVVEVLKGNFCIEAGNSLMILTAYYYLKQLGVKIDNFDVKEFESTSTSR